MEQSIQGYRWVQKGERGHTRHREVHMGYRGAWRWHRKAQRSKEEDAEGYERAIKRCREGVERGVELYRGAQR